MEFCCAADMEEPPLTEADCSSPMGASPLMGPSSAPLSPQLGATLRFAPHDVKCWSYNEPLRSELRLETSNSFMPKWLFFYVSEAGSVPLQRSLDYAPS